MSTTINNMPHRNLRTLNRMTLAKRRHSSAGVFACLVFLLMMQLFIQGNVLAVFGLHINMRVHPANVLLVPVALWVLARGRYSLHERLQRTPALMLFVFAMPMFSLYTIYFNGISGAAFYWDSFWAPGLMALCLEDTSDRERRILARILFAIIIGNVLFGLYESVTQNNIFPFVADVDDDLVKKAAAMTTDFRANAFYPHPLTASLVTAMGLFLMYRMQLRFLILAPSFILMVVGLLAFGGRASLGVSIALTGVAAFWITMSGLVRRNLKLDTMAYMLLAAIAIPVLVVIIVTQTHIAERIMDTMYYDDSAEVRVIQWRVLDYLSLKNWLFGVPMQELIRLKYQIGLNEVEDIENFWLLLFLNLGLVGYAVFLLIFFMFLWHIANVGGGLFGWLLMLSGVIIDSGSNSLGQKTYDLLIQVALLVAMSGFNNWQRTKVVRRLRTPFEPIRHDDRMALRSGVKARQEPLLRPTRR